MKFLFMLVCITAAVAFSLLGIIYGTGWIPIKEEYEPPVKIVGEVEEVATPDDTFAPDKNTVKELRTVLEARKKIYDKKIEALEVKEKEMNERREIVETLKAELEGLYQLVNEKIIVIDESEEANFKRLAEMYSKMEAESAASLMVTMKPERAATVLTLIEQRQAAGILGATVAKGDSGTKVAVEWSDIIRRMENTKEKGS